MRRKRLDPTDPAAATDDQRRGTARPHVALRRVLACVAACAAAGLVLAGGAIAQSSAAGEAAEARDPMDEPATFDELEEFEDWDDEPEGESEGGGANGAEADGGGREARGGKVEGDGIEELLVTATKRTQSVQDVPISVTALQGGFLEETGTTRFAELQRFVPNLQILPVTDTRSTSIRIRGIGSVGTNAGIDPSVGVFIDGVYQGRAGMSVSDLLDIERVEVLRGPQGTLYGKNTAAGAINIITKSPSDEPEVFGEAIVGNYGLVEYRGSANTPLVPERLALRAAGYRVVRDGYDLNRFDDQRVNDADKWGVRGKLRWLATERVDVTLVGDYSVDASTCCVGDIVTYQGPGTLGVTFDDFASATGVPLAPEDPFDRVVGANTQPYNHVTVGGVALDANFEIGSHSLRSLTAWRRYTSDSRFDGDFSVYDAVVSETEVDFHQVSSELLLVSPGGGALEYQTGLYFYTSKNDTDDTLSYTQAYASIANANGIPITAADNLNQNDHRTYDLAGFGQLTWNVDARWSLTGGFRLDWERKTRDGLSTSTCTIPAPPVCGPTDERDEERDVVNPQGTAIVRFRPSDDVMLYASFANGFKSGGFNQLRTSESFGGALQSEFDDERSFNYELGTKTTWLERALLANLTAYFTDYHDFQAQLFNGSAIVVDNAGRLYAWGIEAETRWVPDFVPDRGLVLGASLGLNYTRYADFVGGPITVPQQNELVYANPPSPAFPPNASGLACGTGNYDCTQDLTGARLDNAPRISLSLFGSYERPVARSEIVWFVNANYLLETFKYLDVDLDPNTIQAPINLIGLRTGFKSSDDRFELSFWVENALNEGWLVASSDVPIMSGYMGINAPPRTFGGKMRVNF